MMKPFISRVTPFILLLALAPSAFPQVRFHTGRQWEAPLRPTGFAVGDFNRDGIPDTVVAGAYGSLYFYAGLGDGNFNSTPVQTAFTLQDQNLPFDLLVADLNHDGVLDIQAITGEGYLTALGVGDGTFSVITDVPINSVIVNDQALGDFDGTGNLDLVLATLSGLYIYRGQGDGTFGAGSLLSSGACVSVQAADLNLDGKTDILAGCGYLMQAFPGNGDGTFGAPVNTPLKYSSLYCVVHDLNNDGIPDFVYYGPSGNNGAAVTVFLGNGDLTFVQKFVSGNLPQVDDVEVADTNGDGIPDLLTQVPVLELGVGVWRGNGDGTFSKPTYYNTGSGSAYVQAADLRGNGQTDLVSFDAGCYCFSPLVNQGGGNYTNTLTTYLKFGVNSSQTYDFNNDGMPDLLLSTSTGLAVFYSTGNARSPFRGGWSKDLTGGSGYAVLADFNGDGYVDIASVTPDGKKLTILLGDGKGAFTEHYSQVFQNVNYRLAVGDFNGDGIPDIATSWVNILSGKGDGTFAAPTPLNTGYSPDPHLIIVADLNGDGRSDLLFQTQYTTQGYLVLFLSQPGGGFAKKLTPIPTGDYYFQYGQLADVNGDGLPDLVAVGETGGVQVFLGAPGGSFTAGYQTTLPFNSYLGNPGSLVTGDFNGDGILDIAIPGNQTYAIILLLGNGDGTFTPNDVGFVAGPRPVWAAAGRFTHNGRTGYDDLIILNGNNTLSFLPNTTGLIPADGEEIPE